MNLIASFNSASRPLHSIRSPPLFINQHILSAVMFVTNKASFKELLKRLGRKFTRLPNIWWATQIIMVYIKFLRYIKSYLKMFSSKVLSRFSNISWATSSKIRAKVYYEFSWKPKELTTCRAVKELYRAPVCNADGDGDHVPSLFFKLNSFFLTKWVCFS